VLLSMGMICSGGRSLSLHGSTMKLQRSTLAFVHFMQCRASLPAYLDCSFTLSKAKLDRRISSDSAEPSRRGFEIYLFISVERLLRQ
jgi:hypothetical protein